MTPGHWLVVVSAMLLISLTPGAGAVNTMAMALDHGVRRALWTVAGQQAALAVQLAVVALGVGALLVSSPTAFELVRWAGVAYLVYLGVAKWRERPTTLGAAGGSGPAASPLRLFARGLWVNLLNPKAIVFVLAVVPQLVVPDRPLAVQWVVIALTMIAVDSFVMTGFATLAHNLRGLFRDERGLRRLNRVFGALFCVAAAVLALA